ncbi:hypothetical protein C8F01DRAFT_1371413 [Mycena amicta]|nr:hypothetical protein C8F01DRAFT_1371413 [Mycena amicta]
MSGRLGGSRFLVAVALFQCCCLNLSLCTRVQTRALHPRKHLAKRDALSDSGLTSASWIWTSEATVGNVAFQKTFNPPAGKSAAAATFYITACRSVHTSVQYLSSELNVSTNTFSVLAVNQNQQNGPKPALLAAIQIQYSDNSNSLLVSDASWLVSANIPSDFPSSSSSSFQPATVVETFGSGSLSSSISVPAPPAPPTYSPTRIWSTANANSDAPKGTVGFRKTFSAASGASSVTVFIVCDNSFTLYVNGIYIGAPPSLLGSATLPNYHRVQKFSSLPIHSGASNTVTVFGSNIPNPGSNDAGPAALAAVIVVDGSNLALNTDTTWLYGPFTDVSSFLALPNSALSAAFGLGTLSFQPIFGGAVTGISNGLAAANHSGSFGRLSPDASAIITNSALSSQETGKTTSSIGWIVGVVVAVLIAIGIGLGFLWYCIRSRRRQRQNLPSSTSGSSSNAGLTTASAAHTISVVEPYREDEAPSTVELTRGCQPLSIVLPSTGKLERERLDTTAATSESSSPVGTLSPNRTRTNFMAPSSSVNRTSSASVDGTDAYSMITSPPPPYYSDR